MTDKNVHEAQGKTQRRSRCKSFFHRHFVSTVHVEHLLWPLLLNTLTTGMMDATSFGAFGVFSSNQTGNVIILLSRVIGVHQRYAPGGACAGPALLTTGLSLAVFLVMAFLSGRLGQHFGHLHRASLAISTLVQAILLLLVAVLIQHSVFSPGDVNDSDVTHQYAELDAAPVALLAASAGLQVSQARCSGFQEIPTAMLTSPMVDLLIHPQLFGRLLPRGDKKLHSRNVRAAYLSTFVLGIALGAAVHRFAGTSIVTFIAFALRIVVAVSLSILPPG